MSERAITDYTKILPTGKENAIPMRELAFLLGFESTRSLQADIARSRDAGQVILSSSSSKGGYYLPANDEEIAEFVAVLRSRAISIFKAIRSAKMSLENDSGQMSLQDMVKEPVHDESVSAAKK